MDFCNNKKVTHFESKGECDPMSEYQEMADLLLPDVTETPEQVLARYPRRELPNGARVTRFAPSPTGFLHIGGLFTAMVNRLVSKPDGVCFLRIEDTDKKREVADGVTGIIQGLSGFGIHFDEGRTGPDSEAGDYGPYLQSARRMIYRTFVKSLLAQGKAYPCFCTEEELSALREKQEAQKLTPGYYGEWAVYRDITLDQVKQNLSEGKPFVIRLKSPGSMERRVSFKDGVKGKIEMPENIQDVVILKQDGIPTYHFAHVVDDYLMGTTHVIRGDEWISSTPIHLQLFYMLGLKAPNYAHVSPIMKEEDGGKRKLSKRKDPEASVEYYREQGVPAQSVMEYLMTIANSNFEDWRRQNARTPISEFPFKLNKMSASGALFDLKKLQDVSKNVISLMPASEVYDLAADWAKQYDGELFTLLSRDPQYATAIFDIDRTPVKPRKDIGKWSDVRDYVSYFYDELWDGQYDLPQNVTPADAAAIVKAYREAFRPEDDRDAWFGGLKDLCEPLGFAREVKVYKKDPSSYKGHVGDVSGIIRVAVTGRRNTPDLHSILALLGKERVLARLDRFQKAMEAMK